MGTWLTSERLAVLATLVLAIVAAVLCGLGKLSEPATLAILGGVVGTLAQRYLPAAKNKGGTIPPPAPATGPSAPEAAPSATDKPSDLSTLAAPAWMLVGALAGGML